MRRRRQLRRTRRAHSTLQQHLNTVLSVRDTSSIRSSIVYPCLVQMRGISFTFEFRLVIRKISESGSHGAPHDRSCVGSTFVTWEGVNVHICHKERVQTWKRAPSTNTSLPKCAASQTVNCAVRVVGRRNSRASWTLSTRKLRTLRSGHAACPSNVRPPRPLHDADAPRARSRDQMQSAHCPSRFSPSETEPSIPHPSRRHS